MNRAMRNIFVLASCASVLAIAVAGPCLWNLYGQDKSPQLTIVDRSESKDGLYYCSVSFSNADAIETIGLVLKDRRGDKCGDMLLGTIDTSPSERLAAFFLNHELIKNSFVLIQYSDERPNVKLVVGENQAIRKRNGKPVQVPIE